MRNLHLLVAAAVGVALGCSGDDGPSAPNGAQNTVTVSNNVFTPSSISVPAGTTVTWQWNSGGTAHTVTFDDGVDSGPRSSGPFTRNFPTTGGFPYHCTIHPEMVGTVTVTASATDGTGGSGTGGEGDGGGGYP